MISSLVNIYNYIKENKVLLSIVAALVILLGILIGIIVHKNNNITIIKNNLKAATEEIEVLRTANGDLLAKKQSYVTTINDLENYINISKNEVKDLQKTLDDKILYISELKTLIDIKPTEVHDTTVIYKDSTFNFTFNFSDKWYELTGNSSFDFNRVKTEINTLYVNVPLRVGLTDDWKIFVTTQNPYVVFNDVEGALLDKNVYLKQQKKKKWGISLSLGMYAGYDLLSKNIYIGPGAGCGISYTF